MNSIEHQSAIGNQQLAIQRGWINTFYVTKGGVRRGPYYARVWKVGGKTHKEYIKSRDLKRVQAECDAYRESRKQERTKDLEIANTIGNLNYLYRLAQRQDKGLLRPEDYEHMRRIYEHGYAVPGRPPLRRRSIARISHEAILARLDTVLHHRDLALNAQRPRLGVITPQRLNAAAPLSDNRQSAIENRQSQRFMVPFSTKKQIDSFKNACRKLIAVNYESETTENKWQRWKDERALQPKPTGKFRIALPEWASEDEIDTEIDKYLERRRK